MYIHVHVYHTVPVLYTLVYSVSAVYKQFHTPVLAVLSHHAMLFNKFDRQRSITGCCFFNTAGSDPPLN